MNKTVLDTNLLILYIAGIYNIESIKKIKRLEVYSIDDFIMISNIVKNSSEIIITNSIITEACNLLDSANNRYGLAIFKMLKEIILLAKDSTLKCNSILDSKAFMQFGFTDSEIFELGKDKITIYTDDLKLYHYLIGNNIDVININHLRQLKWSL